MGILSEQFGAVPFQDEEVEPLPPLDTRIPLSDNEASYNELRLRSRTGVDLSSAPTGGTPLWDSMLNGTVPAEIKHSERLNVLDYIEDATLETLAGLTEGASLENVKFGEIGADTSIGDIARIVGRFSGSVVSYGTIAAVLGHLGIFAGAVSAPMVIARAGLTGFVARMLTDVGDPEQDMLDRVQSSLTSGAISGGVSAIPFAFDKALISFHGGPVEYMESLKKKLTAKLIKDFGFSPEKALKSAREFEAEVARQGGAEKLNAAVLRRIEKGQEALGKFLKMQRSVHAIAQSKKSLNLTKDEFYRINISRVGEAHTNRMSPNELRELQKFYVSMLQRSKDAGGEGKQYFEMMKNYTKFNPGFFSGHRPVERVMRQMGMQKQYDWVYDANIDMVEESRAYDMVRRRLMKGVSKGQTKALFHLMDETEIPMIDVLSGKELTDDAITALYAKNAAKYGVDAKNVWKATWLRSTSRHLLKRMNSVLMAEGKDPIMERPAYITHLIQDTGTSLGGITPEIWAALKYGKRAGAVSRFLKQRLGSGDVLDNPFKAHQAYVRAAMKMIHLGPARDSVVRALNAKTVLQGGKKVSLELPENVRRYVDDWLQHGVMGVTTDTDKLLNVTLGYHAKSIAARIKMQGYLGTLWGNPLSVLRNTTQQTLNIARLGRYWIDGMISFNPKAEFMQGLNGWQFAEKYCKLLKGRAPALEGIDPSTMGKLTQIGFSPFRLVDKANIVAGFNGAVKQQMAKGRSFQQALKYADRLVRDTQFNYMNIDQPLQWLSAPGKLGSQFQSWWTRYLEEVWSWGGTMPYGDGTGRTIKIAKHAFNVAKSREMARYLMVNSMILYGLYKAGLPLKTLALPVPFVSSGPLPTGIPPAVSGLLGMGQAAYGTLVGDKRIQAEGFYRVKKQLPLHIVPGYTTIRKFARIKNGTLPPESVFFPISERDLKEQMDRWGL